MAARSLVGGAIHAHSHRALHRQHTLVDRETFPKRTGEAGRPPDPARPCYRRVSAKRKNRRIGTMRRRRLGAASPPDARRVSQWPGGAAAHREFGTAVSVEPSERCIASVLPWTRAVRTGRGARTTPPRDVGGACGGGVARMRWSWDAQQTRSRSGSSATRCSVAESAGSCSSARPRRQDSRAACRSGGAGEPQGGEAGRGYARRRTRSMRGSRPWFRFMARRELGRVVGVGGRVGRLRLARLWAGVRCGCGRRAEGARTRRLRARARP